MPIVEYSGDLTVVAAPPPPDTEKPVITLTDAAVIDLVEGDTYTEYGATWTDNVDGSGAATVGGDTVNSPVSPGTYVVTYNYTDVAGNAADEVIRTINVSAASSTVFVSFAGSLTVTVTPAGITGIANPRMGQIVTITTDGEFDLTTATSIAVRLGSLNLSDVTATSANTATAQMPVDGFRIGAIVPFVIVINGVASDPVNSTILSALGTAVTLAFDYLQLHPDGPLKRLGGLSYYQDVIADDQLEVPLRSYPTASCPEGYVITGQDDGLIIIDNPPPGDAGNLATESEPILMPFALIRSNDNYSRSNVSVWEMSGDVPASLVVVESVTPTTTSVAIDTSYPGIDITRIDYRINGGAWAVATDPLVLSGLAHSTQYTVNFRPVNGAIAGDITTVTFVTLTQYDLDPDAFGPVVDTGVALAQYHVFDSVVVTGASAGQDMPISADGGEVSISTDNGQTFGAWLASTTIRTGNRFRPRHLSSMLYADSRTTTILINSVSGTFTSVTLGDTEDPVIGLILGDIEWPMGLPWVEPGYIALDNADGNLTNSVVIDGNVDFETEGSNLLEYSVVDSSDNIGTATRLVTVVAGLSPDLPILSGPTPNHLTVILPTDQPVLSSAHPDVVAWRALWSAVDIENNVVPVSFNMPSLMQVYDSPITVLISATDQQNRTRTRSALIYISQLSVTYDQPLFATGKQSLFEQRGPRFYIANKK